MAGGGGHGEGGKELRMARLGASGRQGPGGQVKGLGFHPRSHGRALEGLHWGNIMTSFRFYQDATLAWLCAERRLAFQQGQRQACRDGGMNFVGPLKLWGHSGSAGRVSGKRTGRVPRGPVG